MPEWADQVIERGLSERTGVAVLSDEADVDVSRSMFKPRVVKEVADLADEMGLDRVQPALIEVDGDQLFALVSPDGGPLAAVGCPVIPADDDEQTTLDEEEP